MEARAMTIIIMVIYSVPTKDLRNTPVKSLLGK